MKDSYYFSHDYNARNDTKLQDILMTFGMEGIGIFWCIVEMLYEENGKLKLDKLNSYAFSLRCDTNVLRKIISVCFEHDKTYFWSNSINQRLQKRIEKSQKAKESVMARWNKKNTNVLRSKYDSNTIKERKGKEKKENNIYLINKKIVFSFFENKELDNPKIVELAKKFDIREKDVVYCLEDMLAKSSEKNIEIQNVEATINKWINNSIRWHYVKTISDKQAEEKEKAKPKPTDEDKWIVKMMKEGRFKGGY